MHEPLISSGLSPLLAPLPEKLAEWADNNFKLVKGDTLLGDWKNLPYQVAILNWMGNDDIKFITIRKSARTGITKLICANWSYKTTHLRRDSLLYQPTDGDAKKFKTDEIDGLVYHIPALRAICKSDPEKRSSNNTTDRLTFLGTTTDILGGKAPRNFRRMTKDEVVYDELSGFDQDIGGEGGVTTLGDTRFESSSFPKSIRNSTPKIKGSCQISDSIANADVVMNRWIPCGECGEYQVLKWRDTDGNYLFCLESAMYTCVHCGVQIGYDKYADMDAAGQWRSEDGSIIYDEELDQFFQHGEPIPAPRHIGVDKLWSAYSYFLGWEELVNQWNEAMSEKKRTGDLTKLKSFVNTKLGEEWEDHGEKADVDFRKDDRLDVQGDELPEGVLFLTMGVDVQSGKDSRLEYEIVGWGVGEESWSIKYGTINGDPDLDHVWDNLDAERVKIFTREDGVRIRVSCCCVDSGHKPDAVYQYTTPRQKERVYATKGYSESGKPIESGFSKPRKNRQTRLYMVGTDTAKELLYTRLNEIKTPGPGYCHFPEHYDDEYFAQLTGEEKKTVRDKKTGRSKYVWVKTRERNEALDCRIENMVALRILNPNFSAVRRRLQASKKEEPAEEIEQETRTTPTRRPQRRPKKRGWFGHG